MPAHRFTQRTNGRILHGGLNSFEKLLELPRNIKQLLMLVLDMVLISGAMYAAIAMRLNRVDFISSLIGPAEIFCAVVTLLVSAVIFLRVGLYRAVIRFMGQQAIWVVIRGVTYSALALGAALFFIQPQVPRSMPLLYWVLALFLVGGFRLLIRAIYQFRLNASCEKVIIYGAGESGRQLLTALNHGQQFRAVCFVDDDPAMQHSVISGVPVMSPTLIVGLIGQHDVTQVLLALPSISAGRRREIIDLLVTLPIYVRTVPRFAELLQGTTEVSRIEDIKLDDLLNRELVSSCLENDLCIKDKVVLVTGAGGSIGAELCRQILLARPRALILLDNAEYALYNIERELQGSQPVVTGSMDIVALLGSVQDQARLQQVCCAFDVHTVYHAAAYKHVPLVEYNVTAGVANNIFGTWYVAQAAIAAGVETFVLVSTDKAVRPANIMGASKRFAEMLCQGLAAEQQATRFCVVRFGNVLGSSGSVVPLFREQIRAGGPVTVTHPDVSRYFMTVPEAAQLVLQASAMGLGGDVFVLDMGEPVRILDLARRMVLLSGASVCDRENPNGDIEVQFSGLRPGEKLHEELMLGDHLIGTEHPAIMRADDECPALEQLRAWVRALEQYVDAADPVATKQLLLEAVTGFQEQGGMHDLLWNQQQNQWVERSPDNVHPLPSSSPPPTHFKSGARRRQPADTGRRARRDS